MHKYFCLLTAALLVPGLSLAAFITDNIELEVFSQPFNQGAILTTLHSGDEVAVLSSDGDFARVTTASNITGWIEARFLSDASNTGSELITLREKVKLLEGELRNTRDKLATQETTGVSAEEMKKLQQAVKDVGWLRAELNKSRAQVKELETAAKAKATSTSNAQAELETLRAENAELEQRLGAILLVNSDVNEASATNTETLKVGEQYAETSLNKDPAPADESSPQINLEWFLGSLVSAIIVGIILGMVWLDRRMRKRHGGFRLY